MQLWIAPLLLLLCVTVISASKPWPPGCYPKRSMCKRRCGQSGKSCHLHQKMPHWWKCERVHCEPLKAPLHGAVDMSGTVFESSASYSCDKGYHLSKPVSRTCLSSGKWSAHAPTCESDPDCGSLPDPEHGHVHYSFEHHFESIATYSCDQHYELSSPKARVCQASGIWSDCAPTCEPVVDCGLLQNPDYGLAHHPFGTLLESVGEFTCNFGYYLHGQAQRVCVEDGWTGSNPTCDPIECSQLEDPCDGSVVTPSGTQMGDKAYYSCKFGYVLVGEETRECLSNGLWNSTMPCCEIATCDELNAPDNGHVVTPGGHNVDGKAYYWCDACYTLNGASERMCLPNGDWSEMDPTCEETSSGYNVTYMNSCYKLFENPTRWLLAEAACKDDGGKLVEINSPGENAFLADWLTSLLDDGEFWIGAYDELNEGDFIWESTQDTICFANWDIDINEPNNLHVDGSTPANCVAMLEAEEFEWRTRDCLAMYSFVCEIDHDDP